MTTQINKKPMKELHLKRLEKLANHLLHGKLGHKIFNFAWFNLCDSSDQYKKNGCGTAGCALGECPIIFKGWVFGVGKDPIFKGHFNPDGSARAFFNITQQEANHLFHPILQNPLLYGGGNLNRYATKEQVASNMLIFIKLKRKEL